jgi:hypothetical protein
VPPRTQTSHSLKESLEYIQLLLQEGTEFALVSAEKLEITPGLPQQIALGFIWRLAFSENARVWK